MDFKSSMFEIQTEQNLYCLKNVNWTYEVQIFKLRTHHHNHNSTLTLVGNLLSLCKDSTFNWYYF